MVGVQVRQGWKGWQGWPGQPGQAVAAWGKQGRVGSGCRPVGRSAGRVVEEPVGELARAAGCAQGQGGHT